MDRPSANTLARRAQRMRLRRRGFAVVLVLVAVAGLLGGCGGVKKAPGRSVASARAGRHRVVRRAARRVVSPRAVRAARAARAAASAERASVARLLRLRLPIYCAGHRGHEVAFTFDDGPGPYTYLALRKLAGARERATFFVVGRSMDQYRGYIARELRVGAVGDHTYTHPVLIALSASQITWQLSATARKIGAQTGTRVALFRPPYELHNAVVDSIAHRLGLLEILWNVDSQDSLGADYARIVQNVEAGLHPGAIILMHENHGQTIRALTTLLPVLHRRHLRSVSVPELLASDPPSPAQVRKGPTGCAVPAKKRSRRGE